MSSELDGDIKRLTGLSDPTWSAIAFKISTARTIGQELTGGAQEKHYRHGRDDPCLLHS